MSDQPPRIEDAPGLTWRLRKTGWEARWRARPDLVRGENGYQTKSVPLWKGDTLADAPTPESADWIRGMCEKLQDEMLEWSRGGILLRATAPFDGTLGSLIDCYRSNEYSDYQKLRFESRRSYDRILDRLLRDRGSATLAEMNAVTFLQWHREQHGAGHITAGHALITQIRIVFTFGATLLEDKQCQRLRKILQGLRFENAKRRGERMLPEQAAAVIAAAHAKGRHALALAQALQFECTLRQKDVIGEYVPLLERGLYDAADRYGNKRWGRGLRWEAIDDNLILRHVTSKKQKTTEVNLRLAPMVMAEFAVLAGRPADELTRSDLPAKGPIVICEGTGAPYVNDTFRKHWREIAKAAGVPANVWNMDSRAGAISEALLAGAPLDHVRHAATHSDIKTTQGYDRVQAEATASVMRIRVTERNRK